MVQKYELIVSDLADDDLARISKYLTESRLINLIENLLKKYADVKNMPRMYPRLYYEKNTKVDYRKIVYEKYIIIYKIQKNQITILRIVSEKENYLKPKLLKIY